MSSQNQGVSLSSAAEPPMRRKRGRPRKDKIVQGDNSPMTPASEILSKRKLSVETGDSASDMVGQMVSGVIEGSFDAGYLLNVKVGETNMHLRGVVFLPGRFTPITAANDVAPQAKMHKRKEISFPFVGPQGHLHPVSPTSGKSEKPIEHKNDTPKLQDKGLHIGLQSAAMAANESQSASSLIPPVSNLPINDTSLTLGQKVLQDLIIDIGLQNGKAVGFEAFKPMEAPNTNIDVPKASDLVPATFTASLPVSETVNLKPQVEHQALSSDLKSQKLVSDVKSLDLVNDPKSKFPDPEPQAMTCEDSGINMLGKQASKFPEPEYQHMTCESPVINMFGKQASKFPEPDPQVMPCEPAGVNIFRKHASIFPGPKSQAMSCEPVGINMFGKQVSRFPEPESQAIPYELAGINMFGKQSSKFPEPEPQGIHFELTGMNMFGKRASKFPEPQAMPCEPTGNNIFWKQASKFPEPDSQTMPCESTGNNIFWKQASKFTEPDSQAIPCEPTGLDMFEKQTSWRQDIDVSQGTQLELANNKIMTGADVPHINGLFTSDAATTIATAPCSASMTGLQIMIFGAETMPSVHKPAIENLFFQEWYSLKLVVPRWTSTPTAWNLIPKMSFHLHSLSRQVTPE